MNRLIAFRTDRAVHAALAAEAQAHGVSVSRVIRDLITKGMARDATTAKGRSAS
jgi:hypothetical protein